MVAFSSPSAPVNQHANPAWWVLMAGGKLAVKPKVGFSPDVCEMIYLKYMYGTHNMTRLTLWFVLSFLKQYPKVYNYDSLSPTVRRYGDRFVRESVHRGISFLFHSMQEISMEHALHPNNSVPHFPTHCIGSIDTFPVRVHRGRSRYQPKYAGNVCKFQATCSHLGMFCFLSGPHPGAMSDTTLARLYRPNYAAYGLQSCYWLADLAYISVPQMLPPFKGEQTEWEAEFTRVHQFYRARVERSFADLHKFDIVRSPFRSSDLVFLKRCIFVLCGCLNVKRASSMPYNPYSPIAPQHEPAVGRGDSAEPQCEH